MTLKRTTGRRSPEISSERRLKSALYARDLASGRPPSQLRLHAVALQMGPLRSASRIAASLR